MNHTRQLGFIFVLLALFTGPAFANVINVIDYGTNGDGVHENVQSIQKAIDAAAEAGGGASFCFRLESIVPRRFF